MKRLSVSILAGFLIILLGVGIGVAQSTHKSSTNYSVPWDVNAAGGSEMASANYAINSTAGQTVIGPGSSGNYKIGAGYWYGQIERSYKLFLPLGLNNSNP